MSEVTQQSESNNMNDIKRHKRYKRDKLNYSTANDSSSSGRLTHTIN